MGWWSVPLRRLPARQRLAQTDTWLVELFLSLYLLVWGLGFANPLADSFDANPRAYALLARFPGGEAAFGAATVALGLLVFGGVLRGTRPERSLLMGASGVYWLAILVAIGIPTQWVAGGLPHFLLAATACWYCAVRMYRRVAL